MKNLSLFKTAGRQGYILLPRRLLDVLLSSNEDFQKYRVYLYLLLRATYLESTPESGGLERGELYYSTRTLSERMAMSRRTLMRLLDKMVKYGLIEIIPSGGRGQSSRIRMLHYDRLCSFAEAEGELSKKSEHDFGIFWDMYHQRSGLEPIDREMALRYWKRLTAEDRILAMVNIDPYLHSVPSSRWQTAVEYLAYKNFLGK